MIVSLEHPHALVEGPPVVDFQPLQTEAGAGIRARELQDRLLGRGRVHKAPSPPSPLSGPAVPAYLTAFMIGRGRPAASGALDGDGRRTIYLSVRRNFLSPMLLAFDYPIPFSTNGRRSANSVASRP